MKDRNKKKKEGKKKGPWVEKNSKANPVTIRGGL
jgi:hypothetical protein